MISSCASAPQSAAQAAEVQTEETPKTLASESPKMPIAPWTITFADGSANTFRFWQELTTKPARFEYIPVEMAESSSGTYSGGNPKTGELSAQDAETIWGQVDVLSNDVNAQAKSRSMGTGRFVVVSADGQRDFLLQSGPQLQGFLSIIEPFADR